MSNTIALQSLCKIECFVIPNSYINIEIFFIWQPHLLIVIQYRTAENSFGALTTLQSMHSLQKYITSALWGTSERKLISFRSCEFICKAINAIPLAILIWAYFGKYFHCTAISVNTFQICDTISPIDFCTGRSLKIDRVSFECHDGTASRGSSTIPHDALVLIERCFCRYQPPVRY